MPAEVSDMAMPARVGLPPGSPVMDISPHMPCMIWSTPGRSAYGPLWPKPEMLARMMSGLMRFSCS